MNSNMNLSQLLVTLGTLAVSAVATAGDYIWCTMGTSATYNPKRVFVSRIFVAEYRNYITFQIAFAKAVDARYSDTLGSASCLWKADEKSARAGMADELSTSFRGAEVVQVDWPP
jgi:hypothetical protein